MASTNVEMAGLPVRRKFKASELPLNASQRSVIDGLLHTIKKNGEYDNLRKKVWSDFMGSVCSYGLPQIYVGR
jgi:hypothetical protein